LNNSDVDWISANSGEDERMIMQNEGIAMISRRSEADNWHREVPCDQKAERRGQQQEQEL
jgi:hypothetical protein